MKGYVHMLHWTLFMHNFRREYFRDRPRGEFLTRGAALSSQSGGGGAGRSAGVETRGGDGRGATGGAGGGHSDYGSTQRYMAVAAASQAARLGRNLSSEKLGGGQSEPDAPLPRPPLPPPRQLIKLVSSATAQSARKTQI